LLTVCLIWLRRGHSWLAIASTTPGKFGGGKPPVPDVRVASSSSQAVISAGSNLMNNLQIGHPSLGDEPADVANAHPEPLGELLDGEELRQDVVLAIGTP